MKNNNPYEVEDLSMQEKIEEKVIKSFFSWMNDHDYSGFAVFSNKEDLTHVNIRYNKNKLSNLLFESLLQVEKESPQQALELTQIFVNVGLVLCKRYNLLDSIPGLIEEIKK